MSNNSAPIRAINIISAAEFRDAHAGFEHGHELLHWLGSIRYCKAERYGKSTIGTVRVPQKSGERAGRRGLRPRKKTADKGVNGAVPARQDCAQKRRRNNKRHHFKYRKGGKET